MLLESRCYALSLAMFARGAREKERKREREAALLASIANIAECGHCRGTYIGTQVQRGAPRPPGRETDESSSRSSSPVRLLFFFLVLLFFSHYCSPRLRETTASIDTFPRAGRLEETMLYLALGFRSRYYYTVLRALFLAEERVNRIESGMH